ncbi:hypothetical protein A0H81_13071 [Grifola frondosa]|uniref:Uncharacterized protein n=1 Tax=Grifola frondosa TaxID=5627 RepID=A0A1C7LQB0_GRIFR|nr:hypothetical protein A0H81_13071 [Grifola frondosa]
MLNRTLTVASALATLNVNTILGEPPQPLFSFPMQDSSDRCEREGGAGGMHGGRARGSRRACEIYPVKRVAVLH